MGIGRITMVIFFGCCSVLYTIYIYTKTVSDFVNNIIIPGQLFLYPETGKNCPQKIYQIEFFGC